jgi:hypothetical protein
MHPWTRAESMCSPPNHSKENKNRTASAKLRLLWTAVHEEEAEAEKESQQRKNKMDRPVLKTFPSPPPLCNDLQHSQMEPAREAGCSRQRASCSTAATVFCGAVDTPLRCSPDPSNCTAQNIDTPPTVHRTFYSRRAASSDSVPPDAHRHWQENRGASGAGSMLAEQDFHVDGTNHNPVLSMEDRQHRRGVRPVGLGSGSGEKENAHEGGDGCALFSIGNCDSTSTPSPAAADAVSEHRLPAASAESACPTIQPEVPSRASSPFLPCSGESVDNMAAHRPTHKQQEKGGRDGSNEEVSSAPLTAEALARHVYKQEREATHSVEATKKIQDEAAGDAKVAVRTTEVSSAPPPPPPPPPAKEQHAELGEAGAAGMWQIPLRRLHWDKIGIHNAKRTIWQSDAMRHATNRVASK